MKKIGTTILVDGNYRYERFPTGDWALSNMTTAGRDWPVIEIVDPATIAALDALEADAPRWWPR